VEQTKISKLKIEKIINSDIDNTPLGITIREKYKFSSANNSNQKDSESKPVNIDQDFVAETLTNTHEFDPESLTNAKKF
jgi:hypothetical protein